MGWRNGRGSTRARDGTQEARQAANVALGTARERGRYVRLLYHTLNIAWHGVMDARRWRGRPCEQKSCQGASLCVVNEPNHCKVTLGQLFLCLRIANLRKPIGSVTVAMWFGKGAFGALNYITRCNCSSSYQTHALVDIMRCRSIPSETHHPSHARSLLSLLSLPSLSLFIYHDFHAHLKQ
jgi:hypothetical protein